MAQSSNAVPPAARRAWLASLEINDKVKGDLLTAIVAADTTGALQLIEDGHASKKDIRSKDFKLPTGLTALHLAALFGDTAVVNTLLEHNADANVTCFCEITSHSVANKFWMDARPLLFAIGAKNRDIVESLLTDSTTVDVNDAWPLFSGEWWQLTGRFDWQAVHAILRMLVQHKLDLHQKVAHTKWTMLHCCVNVEPRGWTDVESFLQGRYDIVEYLLKNGSDPLLKDGFGRTAFGLIEERSSSVMAERDLAGSRSKDFERLKRDADDRLKELLQKAMVERVDKVRSESGFGGSLRKMIVRGKNLDQIPLLLRRGTSSLRSSSVISWGGRTQDSEMTLTESRS